MCRWTLSIVAALAGCATQVGTAAQPITNGSADLGDPAVIGLADDAGEVGCTATVIAPHTAITAAHCVAGRVPLGLRALFGADVATGTLIEVSGALVDPAFDPATLANDLALITLRDESPGGVVAMAAADAAVGTEVATVGFGTTTSTASDGGTKRAGTAKLSDVQPTEVTVVPDPAQPCHGDSGGPMLLGGSIVAVASRGDLGCSDHAVYARIDVAQQDFVMPYLAATAAGTAATGAACLYDGECANGACLVTNDDPELYFCSQPCTHDADCPASMTCAADGCRYPEPSPGALGSPCTADAACTTGLCRQAVCTRSCLNDAAACPAGYACSGTGLELDCFVEPAGCAGCATGGGAPVGGVIVLAAWGLGCGRARRSGRTARPRGSRAGRS
ncbi:MAG: trypsin-like serine protease [Kofleriaceae bacterium]